MKLSDVKGERTLDVLADLIGPIATLAEDESVAKLFTRETAPEGLTAREFGLQKIKNGLPQLIKGHKRELIEILATIEGSTPEEYGEGLTLAKLAKDVLELVGDEEFVAFFS
jgi:hypothetical protein